MMANSTPSPMWGLAHCHCGIFFQLAAKVSTGWRGWRESRWVDSALAKTKR